MAGTRKGRTAGLNRWSPGLFVLALAGILFASDQRHLGLFVLLAVFVPYLAVVAPFRCREPVRRDGSPCRKNGFGFLIGCEWHRFDKLARIFSRGTRPLRPARATAATAGTRSGGVNGG